MRTIQILRMRRNLDGDLWLNAKKTKTENEAEFIPRAFPSESPSKNVISSYNIVKYIEVPGIHVKINERLLRFLSEIEMSRESTH